MKDGEINIISMIVAPNDFMTLGWTKSSDLTARILRMNFLPKYRDLAQRMGVTSAFRVRAVYQMDPEALLKKIDIQMKAMEAADKSRDGGR